jgi:hypothetical protein
MLLVGLAQFAVPCVRFDASCHALHASPKTDSSLLKSRPSPTPVNLQAETQLMRMYAVDKNVSQLCVKKNAPEQVLQ